MNIIAMVPVSEEDRRGQPYTPASYMQEYACELCGHKGWIGPRQLEVKSENPDTPVLCALCVVEHVSISGEKPELRSLRNPEEN